MPSTTSVPVNVIAGAPTPIPTPQGGGGAGSRFAVVLFNQTPFVLAVTAPGGTYLLLPFTADQYTGPGLSQGFLQVTPQQTTVANGTFLGTVQAMWSNTGEPFGGYPTPLPPFPGGPLLEVTNPGITVTADGTVGGNVNVLTVHPAQGTGSLTFNFTVQHFLGSVTVQATLQGVQTGTIYGVQALASSGIPSATFSILNALDTDFLLYVTATAGTGRNVYTLTSVYATQPTQTSLTLGRNLITASLGAGGTYQLITTAPANQRWILNNLCATADAGGTIAQFQDDSGNVYGGIGAGSAFFGCFGMGLPMAIAARLLIVISSLPSGAVRITGNYFASGP